VDKQPKTLLPRSAKTVERLIQGYSKRALGFIICWHSQRTTYVSRSVELEQFPAVVMANMGDSAATILKYYAKLPEVVMRQFVENKPVIPNERVYLTVTDAWLLQGLHANTIERGMPINVSGRKRSPCQA